MEKYLKTAMEAVAKASILCMEIQSRLVREDSITKKDKSPVTIADFASQALICQTLNKHFPSIPIVGEEDTGTLRQPENKHLLEKIKSFLSGWNEVDILQAVDIGNGKANNLFWTLDPIDGTKGFLRGEQYAVALALIKNGEVVLGVLGCPNLPYEKSDEGSLFYAMRDQGAVANNYSLSGSKTIRVSQRSMEDTVRFLESVESGHANHFQQARIMEAFGERRDSLRVDSQVKYALLASGEAEVYLRLPKPDMPEYREKIWDHAAGCILVEEAGGAVSDIFGKDLDFSQGKKLTGNRGVIATNGQFQQLILDNVDIQ